MNLEKDGRGAEGVGEGERDDVVFDQEIFAGKVVGSQVPQLPVASGLGNLTKFPPAPR